MALKELRDFMSCYNYREVREDINCDVHIFENNNKLIRLFELSNGKLVYLEHRVRNEYVSNVEDLVHLNEELTDLEHFVNRVKKELAK